MSGSRLYALLVRIPDGQVLELSTRYPQDAADRGQRVAISTERLSLPIATDRGGLDSEGRLRASAPTATLVELADPPLTEDELISAHGGLHVVRDDR